MNDERRGFIVALLGSFFAMVAGLFDKLSKKKDPTIAGLTQVDYRVVPFVSKIEFTDVGIEITNGEMLIGRDGRLKAVTVGGVPDVVGRICCDELYLNGDIDTNNVIDCSEG